MSAIEHVVVGRKTPGDGKLEVSREMAHALGGDGATLEVQLHGRTLTGRVSVLECTCTKASAAGKHEHHFVQCDAFRALTVGTQLRVQGARSRLEVSGESP